VTKGLKYMIYTFFRHKVTTLETDSFADAQHHWPLTNINLYCLVAEARVCERLAQSYFIKE